MVKRAVDYLEENSFIKWFSELSNQDVGIAGGKGASLGEMYNNDFPVPPGFVISAQGFDYFISSQGLKNKITSMINSTDMEDTGELQKISKEIRALIEIQKLPKEMEDEIIESYHILSSEKINGLGVSQDALNILKHSQEPIFVSVRSSATTEDSSDASFAGQQESFLNVKGDKKLIEFVKKCFSSLYTPRSIYYRSRKGVKEGVSLLAVVVQKMVDSQKSGVIFSKDPINMNDDIVIEAVYGLGEGIVSGRINPDHYVVDREMKIKEIKLTEKKVAIVRTGSGENAIVKLSEERSKSQVLTKAQILQLAEYAVKLEQHYRKPQDIEYAIDSEKTYIVQSRPITTLGEQRKAVNLSGNILVHGLGSSPGVGVGIVKIIKDLSDLSKIKKGDILVTEMTNPDMVVAMQKSSAIVTDEGGVTAHASIVSRELGIPCVVGTGNATSVLKDGMKITVDGTNGKVYEGEVAETKKIEVKTAVETKKIKLKVILDIPEGADRAAKSGLVDVGLMRLEGIIASSGKHPLLYEKEDNLNEYTELLKKGISKIAEHFKSIWVRTSDIRTDEFDLLKGAPKKEINPMLGLHGIRFSLKHPKILDAELIAIRKVAEKHPEKKFGVMFPQIISVEEVRQAKEHFNKLKLNNMEFGIMVETPAAVQVIDSICREGIHFISFGTNDLTQFTLAVDRGEEDVQFLYNELNPAIFSQIKKVIWACRKYRVQTSICGQAGSKKEMIEFLVRNGINSISVNADAAYEASINIKEAEEKKEEFLRNNPDYKDRWKKNKDKKSFNENRNFKENNNKYQKEKKDLISVDSLDNIEEEAEEIERENKEENMNEYRRNEDKVKSDIEKADSSDNPEDLDDSDESQSVYDFDNEFR